MSARVAVSVLAIALLTNSAPAQQALAGGRAWQVGPIYEHWGLGGLPLVGDGAAGTDEVDGATQWSLPAILTWSLSSTILLDGYVAYASGNVSMKDGRSLSLSGPTDLKVRATARLRGDNLLATFGLGLPTGKTKLTPDEFSALRVLGAPALRFQTPGLGGGLTGTLGAVYTRQVAGWAMGGGLSVEYRGEYSPLAQIAAGLPGGPETQLDPGEAIRASVGIDGLVGENAMSFSLSGTLYTADQLSAGSGAGAAPAKYTLGPAIQLEWQMRVAVSGLQDVTLYAIDRYRMNYKADGGAAIQNTSGNELDFGARGTIPLNRSGALVLGLDGRHHTGISADNSLATAAIMALAGTVGVALEAGGLAVQPFVRAHVGSIDSGGAQKTATGYAFGISVASRLD